MVWHCIDQVSMLDVLPFSGVSVVDASLWKVLPLCGESLCPVGHADILCPYQWHYGIAYISYDVRRSLVIYHLIILASGRKILVGSVIRRI